LFLFSQTLQYSTFGPLFHQPSILLLHSHAQNLNSTSTLPSFLASTSTAQLTRFANCSRLASCQTPSSGERYTLDLRFATSRSSCLALLLYSATIPPATSSLGTLQAGCTCTFHCLSGPLSSALLGQAVASYTRPRAWPLARPSQRQSLPVPSESTTSSMQTSTTVPPQTTLIGSSKPPSPRAPTQISRFDPLSCLVMSASPTKHV
jgi:hypothetical protein